MACKTIREFIYDSCQPSLGGIRTIWLANYVENAATITKEEGADTTELIDGAVTSFAEGVTWTKYPMKKNTASMTSTLNVGEGGSYVTTELSMVFSKMETAKRMAVQALAIGECMALVEDANGELFFLGKDNPLTATAGTGETGTAKGDRNAYTITLTDESLGFPYSVSKDLKKNI